MRYMRHIRGRIRYVRYVCHRRRVPSSPQLPVSDRAAGGASADSDAQNGGSTVSVEVSSSTNGGVGVVVASCADDACRESADAGATPTVSAVEVAPRAVRFAQPPPSNRAYGNPSTAAGALSTRPQALAMSVDVTKGQAKALNELLDWAEEEDKLAA